mmetsp:Transcript_20393/g.57835  ORF Transcript_20393/g.57835 Transcript_20393/m.57835 type:complete len:165 (-) Transcript_20393:3002-3496(-)
MARRRQRWTLAALLLQPASGFYALSRHNARTVLRSSSSDPAADDDTPVPVQKALAAMTAFSNRYVKVSGTKYCSEPSVPAVVIRGLAEHKAALGAPLCPCRNYVDKEAEAKSGYWNCPCVPMRERHECHCMLFLPEEHGFAGDSDEIGLAEVEELTANFKPPPQ